MSHGHFAKWKAMNFTVTVFNLTAPKSFRYCVVNNFVISDTFLFPTDLLQPLPAV